LREQYLKLHRAVVGRLQQQRERYSHASGGSLIVYQLHHWHEEWFGRISRLLELALFNLAVYAYFLGGYHSFAHDDYPPITIAEFTKDLACNVVFNENIVLSRVCANLNRLLSNEIKGAEVIRTCMDVFDLVDPTRWRREEIKNPSPMQCELRLRLSMAALIRMRIDFERDQLRYDLKRTELLLIYNIVNMEDICEAALKLEDPNSPEPLETIQKAFQRLSKAAVIARRLIKSMKGGDIDYLSQYHEPDHWYWRSLSSIINNLGCNTIELFEADRKLHDAFEPFAEAVVKTLESSVYWIYYSRLDSLEFRIFIEVFHSIMIGFDATLKIFTVNTSLMMSLGNMILALFKDAIQIFGKADETTIPTVERSKVDSLWITGYLSCVLNFAFNEVRKDENRSQSREIQVKCQSIQIIHQDWLTYAKKQMEDDEKRIVSIKDCYWSIMQTLAKVANIHYLMLSKAWHNFSHIHHILLLVRYNIPNLELQSDMNMVLVQNLLHWIEKGAIVQFMKYQATLSEGDYAIESSLKELFERLQWIEERCNTAENVFNVLFGSKSAIQQNIDRWYFSTDATLVIDLCKASEIQFLFEKNHVELLLKASEEIKVCEMEWERCLEERGKLEYMKPFPKDSIANMLFYL
jgi:hypothetical protein